MMGAFETMSGSEEAKAKDEEIAAKGKEEFERGIAQMKGEVPSTTAATDARAEGKPAAQPQEQSAKEVSGPTAAPPPSPAQTQLAEPEPGLPEPTGNNEESSQKVGQEAQVGASISFYLD